MDKYSPTWITDDFDLSQLECQCSEVCKEYLEGDCWYDHPCPIRRLIKKYMHPYVFNEKMTRDEAKKKIFAWLYNPDSDDVYCEHAYGRESVVQKYFTQGQVKTFWNKVIPSTERTALNYIIQSTCAENVLRQMIEVSNYLKGCKSYVAFPIHDSIVLDLSVEDKEKLPELLNIFSDTELGKFKVNISVGKDFGNLKKLEV